MLWLSVGLAGLILVVAVVLTLVQRTAPDDPRIAVLPFADQSGDPRMARLGRGLSIDIAADLARSPHLGVIGAESAYAAAQMPLAEAAAWLNAHFLLEGQIEARGETLVLTARLRVGQSQRVMWRETWQGPMADYGRMRDEITRRASASLGAYFWVGALDMTAAEQPVAQPRPALAAYEAYLLGTSKILWSDANFQAALAQFKAAIAAEERFGRAWMMIGVMLLWISDFSPEAERAKLHHDATAALERAFLYAPDDPVIQTMMSVVHSQQGAPEAAQRAILRGVGLAPNDAEVLATAAWHAITAGVEGEAPLLWARRAIDLNPKGPPWHRLAEGIAAFLAQDYAAAIAALEQAPPHHRTFVFLAASHVLSGNTGSAKEAVLILQRSFPGYKLSEDFKGLPNPALERLFEAARLAGVRI